jgi:hypothetical protein
MLLSELPINYVIDRNIWTTKIISKEIKIISFFDYFAQLAKDCIKTRTKKLTVILDNNFTHTPFPRKDY